jgi:molybdopterin/thiamine biosynthesis adenylyltransferase
MNDQELLRYSRHILLPDIGYEGQEQLRVSHALIIGAGGLGSPVALYLAAGGVGHLTICDFDTVDLTNLQRQIIHTTPSVGTNKAISAKATLFEMNPTIVVDAVTVKSSLEELNVLVKAADVVIDCSDNFATRYALNTLCVKHQKPLVSGAAIGFEGQMTVFDLRDALSPCYNCLFPHDEAHQDTELRCADHGVFAPLVGIVGATQAAEAMKVLMRLGETLQGRLLLLDAKNMQWRTINLKKDVHCKVCGQVN